MFKQILFVFFCCALSTHVTAQNRSVLRHLDSIKNSGLSRLSDQLYALASTNKSDSIRKAAFLQLQELRSQDSIKIYRILTLLKELKKADSLKKSSLPRKVDSLRQLAEGFPVAPFEETIFNIYSPSGGLSPLERSHVTSDKIRKITHGEIFNIGWLTIKSAGNEMEISYKDQPLMAIDTTDALWMKTSKKHLAFSIRNRIAGAITSHQKITSWKTFVQEATLALLIILLLTFLIYLVNRFYKKASYTIRQQRGKKIKGFSINGYELINAGMQIDLLLVVTKLFKWALIILLVYLALPILFGLFPWTKGIAGTLFGYILNPAKKIVLGVWHYLPDLFTILVIVAVFRYFLKGMSYLKKEIESGDLKINGFYPDWAEPTYQIIRVLVLAFMIIVIFPYLPGSDSLAFKGVSVFLGVLFTFGSAGPLGNVISGIVLTYMRLFKPGDRVKINDVTGDIVEETLLVVRIKTIKNEIISIPNSTILSNHTINYSSEAAQDGLVIYTAITMSYDASWRLVHELLIKAALATEFIEAAPSPFVYQTSLDDYYVSYQINAYTKQPGKQDLIYSTLHQNIQDIFSEAGLQLLSPHYRAFTGGEIKQKA
jgi:small-conductance mechanosensitive channel